MKTLHQSVQIAIITEIGSTYRNTLLSLLRNTVDVKDCTRDALLATQVFANEVLDKIYK